MNKRSLLVFVVFAIFTLVAQSAMAQFPIRIPKIPKIKKEKVEEAIPAENTQTQPETTSQNAPQEAGTDDDMDFRLKLFITEIAEAKKEIDEYTPAGRIRLVSSGPPTEWMWRAVSPTERAEWMKNWKAVMTPTSQKKFDTLLDSLAESAAKKLPGYTANPKAYLIRNPGEEALMKTVLSDVSQYKIFKIGLNQSNWLIETNNLGIPKSRYKQGMIWLRNTKSDHPYCYFTYVNIIQDYAGGGTYGASYAYFAGDEMAGCPTGK